MAEKRRLWNAYQDLCAERISRRGFLQLAVLTPATSRGIPSRSWSW